MHIYVKTSDLEILESCDFNNDSTTKSNFKSPFMQNTKVVTCSQKARYQLITLYLYSAVNITISIMEAVTSHKKTWHGQVSKAYYFMPCRSYKFFATHFTPKLFVKFCGVLTGQSSL